MPIISPRRAEKVTPSRMWWRPNARATSHTLSATAESSTPRQVPVDTKNSFATFQCGKLATLCISHETCRPQPREDVNMDDAPVNSLGAMLYSIREHDH